MEYSFNRYWHRILHLKKKKFPIFENVFNHQLQEHQRRYSAGWKYRLLAGVLALVLVLNALQVDIISLFQARQFPPPSPRTGPYIPLGKLFDSQWKGWK